MISRLEHFKLTLLYPLFCVYMLFFLVSIGVVAAATAFMSFLFSVVFKNCLRLNLVIVAAIVRAVKFISCIGCLAKSGEVLCQSLHVLQWVCMVNRVLE